LIKWLTSFGFLHPYAVQIHKRKPSLEEELISQLIPKGWIDLPENVMELCSSPAVEQNYQYDWNRV
jgi:hypothetical protein